MNFLRYIFGPKLYMEYGKSNSQKIYEPIGFEKFGDQILTTLHLMWNISFYTSPLLFTVLYRRGYLAMDSLMTLVKFGTSIGLLVMVSLMVRGLGRFQSPSYAKMIKAMEQYRYNKSSKAARNALRSFDYEFSHWDVDFDVKSVIGDVKKRDAAMKENSNRSNRSNRSYQLTTLPCELIAYFAIHTFGIRMMYPGSIRLLQNYMRPMLVSGRAKLMETEHAERYKVRTADSNDIDTVFIDYRGISENGKTLVICSEGNAGFYEIGILSTPLSLKYSVIGWNHPGFEGSTGKPFPDQEKNAIEAVVQFAIYELNFSVDDIILYGWSIGAFSSLWAANCYPNVKGVILDATFDDVLYLAQPRMPEIFSNIVRIAIRNYCNLQNIELAKDYQGPISFIRRTEDEIIAEDNDLETNRGNFLVLNVLKYRYPYIFQTKQLNHCKELLAKPLEDRSLTTAEDDLSMSRLITYASDNLKVFPMAIGEDYSEDIRNQMAEFLLRKHLYDFKSTHCVPLPNKYFNIPWDIPVERAFVLNS